MPAPAKQSGSKDDKDQLMHGGILGKRDSFSNLIRIS